MTYVRPRPKGWDHWLQWASGRNWVRHAVRILIWLEGRGGSFSGRASEIGEQTGLSSSEVSSALSRIRKLQRLQVELEARTGQWHKTNRWILRLSETPEKAAPPPSN